ncbi:MAG: hypothetical protein RR325_02505 [Bacilli bacterium]
MLAQLNLNFFGNTRLAGVSQVVPLPCPVSGLITTWLPGTVTPSCHLFNCCLIVNLTTPFLMSSAVGVFISIEKLADGDVGINNSCKSEIVTSLAYFLLVHEISSFALNVNLVLSSSPLPTEYKDLLFIFKLLLTSCKCVKLLFANKIGAMINEGIPTTKKHNSLIFFLFISNQSNLIYNY